MAGARDRGGHRGRRGDQRDPGSGLQRRHDRGARVRPGRRRARGAGRSGPTGHRPRVRARARRVRGGGCRGDDRRSARSPAGVRASEHRGAAHPYRPRGGLGRGLEGLLPGAAHRPAPRHPPDVAAASPRARRRGPRPRPGHGLRDRASPDDPPLPGRARNGRGGRPSRRGTSPRRRLRLGHPRDRGREARGVGCARRRYRPDRHRIDRGQRPPEPPRATHPSTGRQPPKR